VDDVLNRWLYLPTHHGGIHEIVMWYYVVQCMDALCNYVHFVFLYKIDLTFMLKRIKKICYNDIS
jgi:hypothetical protein